MLPLTVLIAEAPNDELLPGESVARLHWADSLMGQVLVERAPEVTWVLPPELRRVARRAPGMVTDPDRMGQALLRAKVDRVPDPLRAYLRALAAMTDARYVIVPAVVRISTDSTGAVRAETLLVFADTRNGAIMWRSEPVGTGSTPAEALKASIGRILPSLD